MIYHDTDGDWTELARGENLFIFGLTLLGLAAWVLGILYVAGVV